MALHVKNYIFSRSSKSFYSQGSGTNADDVPLQMEDGYRGNPKFMMPWDGAPKFDKPISAHERGPLQY